MRTKLPIAIVIALLAGVGIVVQQATTGGATQPKLGLPRISGAFNPSVTQATINQTICVSGWTRTVRPSVTYTNALKKMQITAYGYKDTNMHDYEEDHFIPLELGGSPSSPQNLWPEPHTTSRASDILENRLRVEVCFGTITLKKGQTAIADWKHTHG